MPSKASQLQVRHMQMGCCKAKIQSQVFALSRTLSTAYGTYGSFIIIFVEQMYALERGQRKGFSEHVHTGNCLRYCDTYRQWTFWILSCRTQSPHLLTHYTHTHSHSHSYTILLIFQLECYPKPTDRCQVLAQMCPLRVSCWERISSLHGLVRDISYFIHFSGITCPDLNTNPLS